MERLFVDTSAWVALVNRGDPEHRAVRDTLTRFAGRRVTSNFVFDETVTLCRYRFGLDVASRLGDTLQDRNTIDLVRVTPADESEAWKLMKDRSDKQYSFTDCTSFVLMRRMRIHRAAALDDDFRREGFDVLP